MHTRRLPGLFDARREGTAAARLRALRKAAASARQALLDDGPPSRVHEVKLITLPYPSSYAFSGLARSPAPFIWFTTRMHIVRYVDDSGAARTLLWNPADPARDDKAPFYVGLRERYGAALTKMLYTVHKSVEDGLREAGVRPDEVDFVAFDHLHVRDVRRWLGSSSSGDAPLLPNAKLLVDRREWACARDLHPLEVPWYVPGGTDGVSADKVVLCDGDVWLGKGVALVHTPGHTDGNWSLAVTTKRGVAVSSENGVATECYCPAQSRIPGVASRARADGVEVVLNGNTRVGTLEQYSSMVLEKELARAVDDKDGIPLFFPSSELCAHPLALGLSPTFSLGALEV